MSTLQGSHIWYELITSDAAAATAFYEAVVEWKITPGTAETNGYGFLGRADGSMTGGLMQITDEMAAHGARPAWLGYIAVDDVDAMVTAIQAKGGKLLMPPADIPMAGRIALVTDCCGAPFYVMTPNGTGPSTAFDRSAAGCCHWNELSAGNAANAIAFYTDLFGWGLPEPMDMGEHGKYQFISHNGEVIGAIMPKMPQSPVPHWSYYFGVPDIDAAKTAIEAHGGQVVHGPMEVPGGEWILNAIDPQGAFFCLASPPK